MRVWKVACITKFYTTKFKHFLRIKPLQKPCTIQTCSTLDQNRSWPDQKTVNFRLADTRYYAGSPLLRTPGITDTRYYAGRPLLRTPDIMDTRYYGHPLLRRTPASTDTRYQGHPLLRWTPTFEDTRYYGHPLLRTPAFTDTRYYGEKLNLRPELQRIVRKQLPLIREFTKLLRLR